MVEQDNLSNQVLTDLTANPPISSTQQAASVSATGTRAYAATSPLAEAPADKRLVPALLGDQTQASSAGVEALLHTETTPHKDSAAAACGTDLPVEALSAGAQFVQLPTAPHTDPLTDRQTCCAPAPMPPTPVIAKTVATSSRLAEEVKPAVQGPVSLELSSQADDIAQAPAGPCVSPAPASGKAQTSVDAAAPPAGLDASSPQATGQASVSLAFTTDDLQPEAPAIAAAAAKPGAVVEAVCTNADGSAADPLPVTEAAQEAAAQETAVPADALKSTTAAVGELQMYPPSVPLAPSSGAQQVGPANGPATSLLQDPVWLPPPPPRCLPPNQAAPCNPAVRSDTHAAVPNSVAPASAHSPDSWWTLYQIAGLAPGLAKEYATALASAPSLNQAQDQVTASVEGSFRELASVPLPHHASMQGAAPIDTAVSKQASGPSSCEEPHPVFKPLSVPTAEKLAAATPPHQTGNPAEGPAGDPVTNPVHAQVLNPPWAGAEHTDANPSIIAVSAAGSDVHVPAANQQLAAGELAEQQPTASAFAEAPASAVAQVAAQAMAPAVKAQPKRATRSRQSAAAKEAAAPAASLTTMTMSEKGRGAELTGQRIEVWWSGEKKYLPGVIKAFSPSKVLLSP